MCSYLLECNTCCDGSDDGKNVNRWRRHSMIEMENLKGRHSGKGRKDDLVFDITR